MSTIREQAAALTKAFGESAPEEAKKRSASYGRGGDKTGADHWKQIALAAQFQVDEERRKDRGKP